MNLSIQETLVKLVRQLDRVSETAALDAQVLLAHYLGKPRSWILAHPEARLNPAQSELVTTAAARMLHGEPLPYIIGHWEFYGLDFQLSPAVLIPRPETELLVERGIKWLHQHPSRRQVVDVGTGSGCIGIALAHNIPDLHILLTDISPDALDIARLNARKYGLQDGVELIQSDLLDGFAGPFDLVCANLPYIPTQVLKTLPVARSEPHLAIDGGDSGIDLISRLLKQVHGHLAPGGMLLLEIEADQGPLLHAMAEDLYPLSGVHILKDLSGHDRLLEIEHSNLIVHLCPRQEWLQAQLSGSYQDASLRDTGFIHCSQPEQLLAVANRFYAAIPDLILLWLDPEKLISPVRWEPAEGALFPHVYGPINLDAVTAVGDLMPDLDGTYRSLNPPV